MALRPERLRLNGAGAGRVDGVVELASYLGPVRDHLVRIAPERHLLVREPTAAAGRLHDAGDTVTVTWDVAAERVFDQAGAPQAELS